MEYLTVKESDFVEVMRQLDGITNSGNLARKIFDFIKNNNRILAENEYYNEEVAFPKMPHGVIGLMIVESRYSINIKKATIFILAILLDTKLKLPIASGILGITGYPTKAITKLQEEDRCLVIDILLGGKKSINDFDYFQKECIQNDINCIFRKESMCARRVEVIKEKLDKLIENEIIKHEDGQYVQCY